MPNTSVDIRAEIIKTLKGSKKPLSIEEIFNRISNGSSPTRQSIKRNIEKIKELGYGIMEIESGRSTKYFIVDNENLFGIPVSDRSKKRIMRMMEIVQEESKRLGIPVGKTKMQKNIYKAYVKFFDNDVFVPYRFGNVAICTPRTIINTEPIENEDKIREMIRDEIVRTKGMTREQVAIEQYKENGMNLHLAMMKARMALNGHEKSDPVEKLIEMSKELIKYGMPDEAEAMLGITTYIKYGANNAKIIAFFEALSHYISIKIAKKALVEMGYDEYIVEKLVGPYEGMQLNEVREIANEIEFGIKSSLTNKEKEFMERQIK